jgi:3-methyladenine DNA glycosylase/8-oxoguanine DNA glycosylase
MMMGRVKIRFELPPYYNLRMVCHTHGWINLRPFHWEEENDTLNFATYIENNSLDISLHQTKKNIEALIQNNGHIFDGTIETLKKQISRCLSLNVDTTELLDRAKSVGPDYENLIKKGAGRLLRSPTLWEDAAKTLFTTNCSWSLTKKICESICSSQFVKASYNGIFPFPPPSIFKDFDEKTLKNKIPIGYRAKYFILLSQRFPKNIFEINWLEEKRSDYNNTLLELSKFQGFGPYATNHMLILLGFYDNIPIDTVVTKYLKTTHNAKKPSSFIKRHYRKWGPYKWWGMKLEKMIKQKNWIGD